MDRRTFLGAVGTTATVSLAGCLGSSEATSDYDVGMSIDSFRPAEVRVSPGAEVTWLNTSSHTHTVTAFEEGIPGDADYFASGEFGSRQAARDGWDDGRQGGLLQGESFSHTFDIPGEYEYFCIPHLRADMVGTVIVEE